MFSSSKVYAWNAWDHDPPFGDQQRLAFYDSGFPTETRVIIIPCSVIPLKDLIQREEEKISKCLAEASVPYKYFDISQIRPGL